ncbi:MAG: enoyl-CoA hydratase [Acidimicrobiia bacterium]|nr:enoyl-CoA hydratase [Acidimicrobiia bacterium]
MTGTPSEAATLLEVANGVATITLNRPENRNALSVELVESLGGHLDAALGDEAVRAVVLTNRGNTFCAGADLKAAVSGRPATPASGRTFIDIFGLILDSPKPIIGKLAGHCLAGGLGLAASCDISVASDEALLGFTEVRIGVAPAVISVVCLPKLRRADALELFLSGERISAARAAEVGLINRSVPAAELNAAVAEVVGKVVLGGPAALALAKQLVYKVPAMGRQEAFDWTGPVSAELFQSGEGQEGITAFREKRPAAWVPSR